MQLKLNSISLSEVNKYSRITGNYRLVGLKTWPHITHDFYWEVTISDGETTLDMFTFSSIQLPIGAMVYIDTSFVEYWQRDHWVLNKIRLLDTLEVLQHFNFILDVDRQIDCAKMPLGEQLKQLKDPVLLKIKAMFGTGLAGRSKVQEQFSFYETDLLRNMLSWLLCIEFDSLEERDYAVCGGMIFMLFSQHLTPNYRLDSTNQRDMQFAEFVVKGIDTLAKLDDTLASHFECLMKHTLPLSVPDSRLSEVDFIRAIQLVHFHIVAIYDFQHERKNNAA